MPPAPAFILPSQRVEQYEDIKIRIQAAVTSVENRQKEQINVAELARTYEVPVHRLRARLQGRQSRQERPGANRKLTEDQKLVVCQYLDRLDTIGTSARIQMVSGCANAILQYSHLGDRPAPQVGDHWAPVFLTAIPNTLFASNTLLMPTEKMPTSQKAFVAGLKSNFKFVSSTISSLMMYTISTRPAFALELVAISGLSPEIQAAKPISLPRQIENWS